MRLFSLRLVWEVSRVWSLKGSLAFELRTYIFPIVVASQGIYFFVLIDEVSDVWVTNN